MQEFGDGDPALERGGPASGRNCGDGETHARPPWFSLSEKSREKFQKKVDHLALFFYGISSQVFGVFFQNFDPISEIFCKSDIRDSVGFREMEVILL